MKAVFAGLIGLALLAPATGAAAQTAALRPDRAAFRAIYQELVETNTTLSAGSCTEAAAKMGARLKAAGYADADLTHFADPSKPKEGGLVAVLKGSDPKARPILLLGHLDVVEARREDWTRDPFVMVEEDGFFYGRGVADMKAMDAIWVDTLIRLKQAGKAPRRTLKMALTCGEETAEAFNGAGWLVKNRPDLIDAAFVLNEGGGGDLSADGQRLAMGVQVGQKAAQSYMVEVTDPGGHSSRPKPENPIYRLAEALLKVRGHTFPVQFTDTTRTAAAVRAALKRLLADPTDAEAARIASGDLDINSSLRTTCVTTRLDAGHANNALPQRARATVNCRIFPGESVEATRETLVSVIADPKVTVTTLAPVRPIAVVPPLSPEVIGPMKALAARHFPGVPFVPDMSAGATDGRYFGPANIPVYGAPGLFFEAEGNGAHGLNERMRASSVYAARDYLHDLVRAYIGVK